MVINPLEQFEVVDIKIGLSPMTNLSLFMIIPIGIFGLLVMGMVRGEVNRWVGNRWVVYMEFIVRLIMGMGKGGGEVEYPRVGLEGEGRYGGGEGSGYH